MKIQRDECGLLHIEAAGIEVVVENEDATPRIVYTMTPAATRGGMSEVASALKDTKRWPTRRLPRI